MKNEKLTYQDAVAFSEAVAEYIENRNPKLPGCLRGALWRHKADEYQETRHARIMWIAARAMGLGDLAEERVRVYRADGAERDRLDERVPTDEDHACRESSGLDSAIRRGLANMDELSKIVALGSALIAVALSVRE